MWFCIFQTGGGSCRELSIFFHTSEYSPGPSLVSNELSLIHVAVTIDIEYNKGQISYTKTLKYPFPDNGGDIHAGANNYPLREIKVNF